MNKLIDFDNLYDKYLEAQKESNDLYKLMYESNELGDCLGNLKARIHSLLRTSELRMLALKSLIGYLLDIKNNRETIDMEGANLMAFSMAVSVMEFGDATTRRMWCGERIVFLPKKSEFKPEHNNYIMNDYVADVISRKIFNKEYMEISNETGFMEFDFKDQTLREYRPTREDILSCDWETITICD